MRSRFDKGWLKVWAKRSLWLAYLGVPALVFTVYSENTRANDRIRQATSELKALGYPVSLAELNAQAPETHLNAEPIYLSLFREMEAKKLWERMDKVTNYGGLLSPGEEAILNAERAFIQSTARIRQRPNLWFKDAGQLGAQYRLSQLLIRQMLLNAKRGRPQEALNQLETVDAMLLQMAQTPHGAYRSFSGINGRNLRAIEAIVLSGDRSFAMKVRRKTTALPKRMNVQSEVASVVPHVYTSAGHPLVTFTDIDSCTSVGPITGVLWRMPGSLALNRAALLEGYLNLAKRADNGLTKKELQEISDLDYFDARLWIYRPTGSGWDEETANERAALVLAAIDIEIERLGGPKANIPKGFEWQETKEGWRLDGPSRFLQFNITTCSVHEAPIKRPALGGV